jgi:hypothetical protein
MVPDATAESPLLKDVNFGELVFRKEVPVT